MGIVASAIGHDDGRRTETKTAAGLVSDGRASDPLDWLPQERSNLLRRAEALVRANAADPDEFLGL
jgi:hypothetical protein